MVKTRTSEEPLEPFEDNPEKLFRKKSENKSDQFEKESERKLIVVNLSLIHI